MVMIYSHKKTINNQEGAAMIEFAIILPLLLLLIFGIIEFSLFLFNKQVITNAAREGARRGVIMRAATRDVSAENVEIIARVNEFAEAHLITFGAGSLSIVPLSDTRETSFGTDLVVEANFLYDFLFLSTIGIGPINLQSVATMRME